MRLFERRPLAVTSLLFFAFSFLFSLSFIHLSPALRAVVIATALVLATVAIAVFIRTHRRHFFLLALAIAALLGLLSQGIYDATCFGDLRTNDANTMHTLRATVTEIGTEGGRETYTVKAEAIDGESTYVTLTLYPKSADDSIAVGKKILCDIIISDYADAYMRSRGIAGCVSAVGRIEITGEEDGILTKLSALRTSLTERILRGMSGERAALLSALLLGDRSGVSDEVTLSFRRAGASHALALSGLHLSVLALLLLRFLRSLETPGAVRFAVLLGFLAFYSALAGFPTSLLRAAGMLILAELGRLLRLTPDGVTSLALSVALITLLSPATVTDVGLWLSFLATLGILIVNEVFPVTKKRRAWPVRALLALLQSLGITVAAVIFTLLPCALIFGEISVLSPLTNLLLAPLVHLLLLLGPLVLAFPLLLGPICDMVAELALAIIRFFADVKGASLPVNYPISLCILILFSLSLILILAIARERRRLIWLIPAFSLLVVTLLGARVSTAYQNDLCYTQEGGTEATLIVYNGCVTVIAEGGTSTSAPFLTRHLSAEHINEIDTLILTECTEGTAAWLATLSAKVRIREVILPMGETEAYGAALQALVDARIKATPLEERPMEIAGGAAITLISAIPILDTEESGYLLSLDVGEERICIAPTAMLAVMHEAEREAFFREAAIVIAGRYPECDVRLTELNAPEGASFLFGDKESTSAPLLADTGGITTVPYEIPLR